eukprot:5450546-Amphidinium_carterae.1
MFSTHWRTGLAVFLIWAVAVSSLGCSAIFYPRRFRLDMRDSTSALAAKLGAVGTVNLDACAYACPSLKCEVWVFRESLNVKFGFPGFSGSTPPFLPLRLGFLFDTLLCSFAQYEGTGSES